MTSRSRAQRDPAERFAASQYHVISRAQASEYGLSASALRHRIREGGPWRRVLPGVYLTATGAPGSDQLLMAALLYAGEGSLVTGLAALRRYKIKVPDSGAVDVLIPASRNRVATSFVVPHRTTRLPRRFGADGPIRFTVPARAVADAARGLSRLSDIRAVAAAVVQQGRCTVADLAGELDGGPQRWSGRLRMVLAEVRDGVRSAAEAELRELIASTGLPVPMFNPRLIVGGRLLAIPDAWWPKAGLVVEVDSREWHLTPADWEATMRRHAELTAVGVLVLHFSPRQIRTEPGVVVAAIQNALRAGRPLAGITTLPVS